MCKKFEGGLFYREEPFLDLDKMSVAAVTGRAAARSAFSEQPEYGQENKNRRNQPAAQFPRCRTGDQAFK